MNHTQAIREIMILNNVSLTELGRRLGLTHMGVLNRINSKTGRIDTTLQILEAMGYEMVVRPQTEGDLLEGEYALRFRDYQDSLKQEDQML